MTIGLPTSRPNKIVTMFGVLVSVANIWSSALANLGSYPDEKEMFDPLGGPNPIRPLPGGFVVSGVTSTKEGMRNSYKKYLETYCTLAGSQ